MAFVIADRVRESSVSTGTGNFTLGGAVTGYQTFASALSSGDTTYYTIADQGGANWEVGIGTFTSPSTLARTTILSSSNGGSVVTFGAGTKDVFISLPASKTVQSFSAGSTGLSPSTATFGPITLSGTLAASNGGTGQTSFAVGDLLYASTTTALSKLADVATGNALISGGVGVAPSYGKIGLTTHVSGKLPVENGGTGTATAFTTGSVVFANASGIYNQNNSQFFWDNTNNRLGIGLASPTAKLHISSSRTAVTNSQTWDVYNGASFENSITLAYTGSVTNFGNYQSNPLAFITNNTERMRVDASGNVGIGTSSPASPLQVSGTARFGAGPSDATNATVAMYSDGNGISIEAFQGNNTATKRNIWLNAYGGAVGIGTTSPDAKLTVNGVGAFGDGSVSAPGITNTGDLDTGIYFSAANTIDIATGGTAALQLDSSQNLKFNSGYGSVATAYACRAWVNFNGTGTLSIRGSGNVSSVTDHGTGDFTVNFSSSMPDANYSVVASGDGPVNGQHCTAYVAYSNVRSTFSSSAVAVAWFNATNSASRADPGYALISVFR